jgi:O-antigen/teichoic acid export membrane protein
VTGTGLDVRATARNAGLILVQRGAVMVAGVLFAAVVPRMMGPPVYGQYALLASLAAWMALLSGLGFTNTISRHMPTLVLAGKTAELRRFLGGMLALRVVSGAGAGAAYLAVTLLLLRDLPPLVPWIFAGAVWLQTLGNFFFGVFLGFNRAARWVVGDVVRRWLLLVLLPLGFALDGLRGACLALLVTEAVALVVGLAWTRLGLSVSDVWPRAGVLEPHLRFGVAFLGTQVLFAGFNGSGELLVRTFTGEYGEVGYFALAHSAYLMAVAAITQFVLSFAPLLGSFLDRGERGALDQWVGGLLKGLAVLGALSVFGALFLADPLVTVVFGAAYHPVAPNLVVLALGLLPLTLGSVFTTVTLVHDRPGLSFVGSALRLAVLWGAGPVLVARWGSLGACLAVLGGSTLHAVVLAWRLRDQAGPGLRSWVRAIVLALPFLPLLWLRSSPLVNGALFLAFVAGYGVLLLLSRVVTWADLRVLGDVFRRGGDGVSAGEPTRRVWPEVV